MIETGRMYAMHPLTTMPEYRQRAGQVVQVTAFKRFEANREGIEVYAVKAEDGWKGYAFEEELTWPDAITPQRSQ